MQGKTPKLALIAAALLLMLMSIGAILWVIRNADPDSRSATDDPFQWDNPPGRWIEAPLLAPLAEVRGVQLPAGHSFNSDADTIFDTQPARVRITLTGGKEIQTPSMATSVWVRRGKVTSVHVTPMQQPASFDDTTAMLRSMLVMWGFEPSEQMSATIQSWGTNVPGNEGGVIARAFRTGMALPDGSSLGVRVAPAPEAGWYLAISVGISGDQYEALRDAQP